MNVIREKMTDEDRLASGYTRIANHIFLDKKLSLKAKGFFVLVFSLPDSWDYSMKGFGHVNSNKSHSTRTALKELEKAGFVTVEHKRDELGQYAGVTYLFHEKPVKRNSPATGKSKHGKSERGKSTAENPTQSNKKERKNKDKEKTNQSNGQDRAIEALSPKSIHSKLMRRVSKFNRIRKQIEEIKEQIDYDGFLRRAGVFKPTNNDIWAIYRNWLKRKDLDDVVDAIAHVLLSEEKTIRVNKNNLPAPSVQEVFRNLNSKHVENALECFKNRKSEEEIRDLRSYFITVLYNAPNAAQNPSLKRFMGKNQGYKGVQDDVDDDIE